MMPLVTVIYALYVLDVALLLLPSAVGALVVFAALQRVRAVVARGGGDLRVCGASGFAVADSVGEVVVLLGVVEELGVCMVSMGVDGMAYVNGHGGGSRG